LALEHRQRAPLRNQHFIVIGTVRQQRTIDRRDHQTTFTLGFLAERNGTGDFRENCRLFRFARFKQVGNARQTTGDVAGLRGFLWDTCDDVTHFHLGSILQTDDRVGRQEVMRRHVGTCEAQLFTVIVDQRYRRAQILTGNRALGRVHDRGAGQTGQFVGLTFDRDALVHTGESHTTRHLGDDRVGVRIPGRNDIAGLDRTLVRHLDGRTVGQLVAFFFAASRIGYRQLTGAADRHPGALVFLDDFQVVQTHLTVGLDLDIVLRGSPRCRTTDVEGTHRQLRARLTDRLRSNNADSFTGVDAVTTGQIAAVADRADTVTGFTGDRRTHEDFVDTHLLEQTDPLLVDHRAGINHHLFGARTHDIPGHDTTQDAIAQRFDDVATGNDRGHAQAVFGAAIGVGDDQILRHVDQTAGQVTRVRGFQRGIGQTFTRTVGRDEVLQNRQTFAEVCGDRRLDDRAVRLRHQAAHTGELTDLGRRAPCARIGVHEHRVERRLALFLAFLIDDRLGRQTLHHRLGNEVVGARPDVDHLVVFLALGHQTRSVLLFDFNHFLI